MMRVAIAAAALVLCGASAWAQQQHPTPVESMSRQQLREELTRLRALAQGRAVLPQRPAGCTASEHRQFDFWLGEWDVSPSSAASGATIAESSVTLADQGCVIIEHWRPFGGAHGHSLNMYDPATQAWHQTWMAGRLCAPSIAAPSRTG
ncbi:MAG: hypothetical protein K2P58_05085 [Hyphomonadaceae bacterium]|nr:hypothetical protein [Hyphomonadaceae bacterium]